MSKNITRAEAWELLNQYNKEQFHLKHAVTVEGVMKYFANALGYGDEAEFWGIVGLLHDLDFEQFPEADTIEILDGIEHETTREEVTDENPISKYVRKEELNGRGKSDSGRSEPK